MERPPKGAAARLRLLYEVTTLRTGTAGDRLEAALEAIARSLSLNTGVVMCVDGTTATIAQLYNPDGALREGESTPLEETYCDLTLRAGGVLSISRMGTSPYAQRTYYRRSGNESYIGAAVTVNGGALRHFGILRLCSAYAFFRC